MKDRLRVIQWATGAVGRHAVAAIAAHPGLELVVYSNYASSAMLFDIMGFGRPPDAQVPLADPRLAGTTFRAPILLVADGLGATIDEFACLGTAMHAIHAIPHVCAAEPGIRTFLDLPIIAGRGALALGSRK